MVIIERGCGTLYISEPTLLRDVAQVITFIPIETDGIKIIKKWLQTNNISPNQRLRSSYSSFSSYEEIESPDFDVTTLQYILQMVCGDAAYEYEIIKPEYYDMLRNWKEMISAEKWVGVLLVKPTYDYLDIEYRSDIIDYLNDIISRRVYYGVRTEVAQYDGFMLLWSNSVVEWLITSSYINPYTHVINKGKKLELDANEIFAPFPRDILESVRKELAPLPLYSLSMEAKLDKDLYMEIGGKLVRTSSPSTLDWYRKQIESIYMAEDKHPAVDLRILNMAEMAGVYPEDALSLFNTQAESFMQLVDDITNLINQDKPEEATDKYKELEAADWINWAQEIIGM